MGKGCLIEGEKVVCGEEILPDNFFSNGISYITVSAIVSEKGMGKSSLIAPIYRLINNMSYALRVGLGLQKQALHFVRDISTRGQENGNIRYI